MSTIAIIGVGAIGSATAAAFQLATIKHTIVLCTRRPLQRYPLIVTTPSGPVCVEGTNLTRVPKESSPVDWVIISTKAYHALTTSTWFPALVGSKTRIAVLQNGVEHWERFAPYLSTEHRASLLPVMIDCPAEKQPDSTVLQRAWAKMVVPTGALGSEFASLFEGSNAQVILNEDWTTAAWKKLCLNAAGALSALTLLPNRVIAVPGMKDVALGIVRETIAAGNAVGARIDDDHADAVLNDLQTAPGEGVNSLLADRLAAREMEIEARNGAVVRAGRVGGIDTPLNGMIVAVLTAQQSIYLPAST